MYRRALAAACLLSLLLVASPARASNCEVECIAQDWAFFFGFVGTITSVPVSVAIGGRNLFAHDGDDLWDAAGYASGALSIGSGALLVGLGLNGYYPPVREYMTEVGAFAIGAGVLSVLIPLLPDSGPDERDHFAIVPGVVVDRAGDANPTLTLSLGGW